MDDLQQKYAERFGEVLTEIKFRLGWILFFVVAWSILGAIGFFFALVGACAAAGF